ncbi:hypothetical protein M0802_005194 [Mischocyttarus mexicanus]|nr:hypothetical protein M0802_005194 [Mischocyttarus mexicanus]
MKDEEKEESLDGLPSVKEDTKTKDSYYFKIKNNIDAGGIELVGVVGSSSSSSSSSSSTSSSISISSGVFDVGNDVSGGSVHTRFE